MKASAIRSKIETLSVRCYAEMARLDRFREQLGQLEAACRDLDHTKSTNHEFAQAQAFEAVKILSQASSDIGSTQDKFQDMAYSLDRAADHIGEAYP